MKKLFEGASAISAFLLILTAAFTFLFNIHTQKEKKREAHHAEKIHRKDEKRLREDYRKKIEKLNEEKALTEEELEYHKKLRHPLWHYYDWEKNEFVVLPGKYGIDEPPPRPKDPVRGY